MSKRLTRGSGLTALITVFLALAMAPAAFAQATRTWVSGVGDDANPCSRTAPCKTFAGAISKTAAGGEIDALDPGGFGALTITKAITIDGGGGQVASVLVAGTNGIVVAAGASDRVIIRNLRLDGLGPGSNAGINGIRFTSGARLTVQNVDISGFGQNGVDFEPSAMNSRVTVDHATIENNGGAGVLGSASGAASGRVTITNSSLNGNGCGVAAGGTCSSTTGAAGSMLINVVDSSLEDNTGAGVLAVGPAGGAAVSNDLITGNNFGLQALGGGLIFTFGDNTVFANSTDGSGTGSTVAKRAKDVTAAWTLLKARAAAHARAKHHVNKRARRRSRAHH